MKRDFSAWVEYFPSDSYKPRIIWKPFHIIIHIYWLCIIYSYSLIHEDSDNFLENYIVISWGENLRNLSRVASRGVSLLPEGDPSCVHCQVQRQNLRNKLSFKHFCITSRPVNPIWKLRKATKVTTGEAEKCLYIDNHDVPFSKHELFLKYLWLGSDRNEKTTLQVQLLEWVMPSASVPSDGRYNPGPVQEKEDKLGSGDVFIDIRHYREVSR